MSKKVKKIIKEKKYSKSISSFHGVEHDLLMVAGLGFILIIIIMLLLGYLH